MLIHLTRRKAIMLLLAFWGGLLVLATQPVLGNTGLIEPADSEKTTSLSERLKKRKDELKLSLGESAKQRLAGKCAASQAVVKKLKTRDAAARDKYHSAYTKMIERLEIVATKLAQQGVSTSGLANAQQLLTDSVNQYLSDAEAYRAAVDDLANMDCKGDLEGFQATLVTARSLREKLASDAALIKTSLKDVTAALAGIKNSLQAAEAGSGRTY